MSKLRSFTLIELLIVVGVIGILSGAVLVVINPSKQRDKAADAVIFTTMGKLTTSLESYYAANFSYPTDCAALASDTTSRVTCKSGSTMLFSIDGVTLPSTCSANFYSYSATGTTQCYFYYWNASRPGCIFVNSNGTSGNQYYVARYGKVMSASNYGANGCDAIPR